MRCRRRACLAGLLPLVCVLGALAGIPDPGAYGAVIAEYTAVGGTTVAEPGGRWTAQNVRPDKGNLGFPVEDDLGLGVNAWQIADQAAVATNPVYSAALTSAEISLATNSGWRFSMTGRYVFDFGDAASLGFSAFVGARAYELRLDLSSLGDLQATLLDESPRVHTLTTGGTGPLAYHDFTLQFDPMTALTSFRFDGAVVDTWDGLATLFLDSVQWGNDVGATRGIMNYHSVAFEVAPPVGFKPGDYDADGDVDGADLLGWQRGLGSSVNLAADGNANGVVDAADLVVWRTHFGAGAQPGDYNSDGLVDGADMLAWQRTLGSNAMLAADGSGNAVVDAADLAIWRNYFGVGGVAPVAGDYDGDREVNGADLLAWQRTLGSTASLAADGNGNGVVDAADLAVWRTNFGSSGVAAALTTVPEPQSFALLALALAALVPLHRAGDTRCNVVRLLLACRAIRSMRQNDRCSGLNFQPGLKRMSLGERKVHFQ